MDEQAWLALRDGLAVRLARRAAGRGDVDVDAMLDETFGMAPEPRLEASHKTGQKHHSNPPDDGKQFQCTSDSCTAATEEDGKNVCEKSQTAATTDPSAAARRLLCSALPKSDIVLTPFARPGTPTRFAPIAMGPLQALHLLRLLGASLMQGCITLTCTLVLPQGKYWHAT